MLKTYYSKTDIQVQGMKVPVSYYFDEKAEMFYWSIGEDYENLTEYGVGDLTGDQVKNLIGKEVSKLYASN